MSPRQRLRGTAPTDAELLALRLVLEPQATHASAAQHIHISESAINRRLGRLYARLGVTSAGQASLALGWGALPRVVAVPPSTHKIDMKQHPENG